MKNLKVLKTVLIFSGLIASAIGAAIVLIPTAFYATYSIKLGSNVSLLNEMSASGGFLLVTGILIISGAFIKDMTFTALVVSTLLYLSYGFTRVLSMIIDVIPAVGLVQSAALEIAIGLVCAVLLVKYKVKPREIAK